jgi:hypothetical protein
MRDDGAPQRTRSGKSKERTTVKNSTEVQTYEATIPTKITRYVELAEALGYETTVDVDDSDDYETGSVYVWIKLRSNVGTWSEATISVGWRLRDGRSKFLGGRLYRTLVEDVKIRTYGALDVRIVWETPRVEEEFFTKDDGDLGVRTFGGSYWAKPEHVEAWETLFSVVRRTRWEQIIDGTLSSVGETASFAKFDSLSNRAQAILVASCSGGVPSFWVKDHADHEERQGRTAPEWIPADEFGDSFVLAPVLFELDPEVEALIADEQRIADEATEPVFASVEEEIAELAEWAEYRESVPSSTVAPSESGDPGLSAGASVRFRETYSTGILVDGGPTAPEGFETFVEEVSRDGSGALVRFPEDEDGFAPRQFVPSRLLEVEPDFSDSTHCRHGSFVGDWAGPDYLCGACEDGLSAFGPTDSEIELDARVDARARELVGESVHESLVGLLSDYSYSTVFAGAIVDAVLGAVECRPSRDFVRSARVELSGAPS